MFTICYLATSSVTMKATGRHSLFSWRNLGLGVLGLLFRVRRVLDMITFHKGLIFLLTSLLARPIYTKIISWARLIRAKLFAQVGNFKDRLVSFILVSSKMGRMRFSLSKTTKVESMTILHANITKFGTRSVEQRSVVVSTCAIWAQGLWFESSLGSKNYKA